MSEQRIIRKVSKTREGKFVLTFDAEVGGTQRIVLSKKQYANAVESLGIPASALNQSMVLVQGSRADLSVENRIKGDTYTDTAGKAQKYTKDHSVVSVDGITLGKASKAIMLDIAKESILRASVADEFDEDDFSDDTPSEVSAE